MTVSSVWKRSENIIRGTDASVAPASSQHNIRKSARLTVIFLSKIETRPASITSLDAVRSTNIFYIPAPIDVPVMLRNRHVH